VCALHITMGCRNTVANHPVEQTTQLAHSVLTSSLLEDWLTFYY